MSDVRRPGVFTHLAIVILLLVAYLLLWPIHMDPESWTPPEAPELAGPYAVNDKLAATTRLVDGQVRGPEDVAEGPDGFVYGGLADGRIVKVAHDGSSMTDLADTEGRPLGMHFDAAGNLIVCDAYKGLLSINPDGEITVLTTEQGGKPFVFTDDVDIASDGTIYFSDASWKYHQKIYKDDALEHRPLGRLLAYHPDTGETVLLLDNLYFANGVALSPDESFVLVNETWKYRITRYWLTGEKKGTHDIFIDNLPGFPDGVSCNGKDTFWVGIASPRDSLLDSLLPHPFLRKIVARLPNFVRPDTADYGFVLGLDVNGKVTRNLQDPTGKGFRVVTSVEEVGDRLYLGSLKDTAIGYIPTPR
ncbi:SMP-30/gluconolactonase/LRE family protein [bacterium]|nr:SMP-30/gluconolactonase/LRE family protein [bacterium]